MTINRRIALMTPLLLATRAAQALSLSEGQQAWQLRLPDGMPTVRCWLYMPPGSLMPGKTWMPMDTQMST